MNQDIFREYDVRGVFGRDFDLQDARRIGQGFGTELRRLDRRAILVGRDGRLSSPAIREALTQGLMDAGMDVTDLGLCSTPLFYFALHRLRADGGVMVTASHNPPDHNGFKLCLGPDALFGDRIQDLRRTVASERYAAGVGSYVKHEFLRSYVDYFVHHFTIPKPVRVAVDAGNGVAGIAAGPVFRRLGLPVAELYFDVDGRFPHHPADPTVAENMAVLAETVVREGCDLGVGFDGDADRIGVVDERGRLLHGDMLTMIFAREILAEHPGGTIVADVKCSQLLFDDIAARGGRPVMGRSGHSLMKQMVKDEGALLGGELSGHICFADRYFGFDDALYAACRLLEIVARRREPISRYLADLPPVYHTPEIRRECPEEMKFKLVDRVREELGRHYETIDLDGVRVVFPDGWGLLRASNTQPALVLRFEARSEARLRAIQRLMEETLERVTPR